MEKTLMTGYAVATNDWGYFRTPSGQPVEHVFVLSALGHDWGCFGGSKEYLSRSDCREITKGIGYSEWAHLLNGPDPIHPTGIRNKIDGSCHCVANRLLVLANTDVSSARGDALIMLFYGKYGFRLDEYVERVKQTASELNKTRAGSIDEQTVETVLQRLSEHMSDEIDILRRKFEETIGADFSALNDNAKSSIRQVYEHLHSKRYEKYSDLKVSDGGNRDQKVYSESMKPVLAECLHGLHSLLGNDLYMSMFKVTPDCGVDLLLRLI